jgi:hypothetical protein
MPEYVSSIDGHMHFGEAARAECVICRVEAQRDALQARIDAYEGRLEEWEEIDRLIAASSLGTPEAEAIRNRTPPGVGMAITKAAQYMARAEEAEFERDRMRPVVDAAVAYVVAHRSLGDRHSSTDEIHEKMIDTTDALIALANAVKTWRTDP